MKRPTAPDIVPFACGTSWPALRTADNRKVGPAAAPMLAYDATTRTTAVTSDAIQKKPLHAFLLFPIAGLTAHVPVAHARLYTPFASSNPLPWLLAVSTVTIPLAGP